MKFRPRRNLAVVRRVEAEDKTAGGIITNAAKDKLPAAARPLSKEA